MFCPNCGKELPDGSAFCGNCGAQLNASAQQPGPQGGPQQGYQQPGPQGGYQQQPQQPQRPSAAATAFSGLVPYLKSYLASPITAAKELAAKRDMATAIILLAIQAIVSGLVIFSVFSKICGMVKDLMALGMGSDMMGVRIGPSFIMSLIWGIVAAAVAIAVFVVVVFAVLKLMQVNCTIQDVLVLCGAHSLFVTALLLISFILFFLNIWLGLIFFSGAMIAWVVMGVVTAQTLTTDMASGKFWMLLIAGILVAQLVGGFVASKCIGGAFEAITISAAGQSMSIGQLMDLGELAMDDIMEGILGGF